MGYGRPLRARPPIVESERRWPEASWWAEPAQPVDSPRMVGPLTWKRV